MNQQAVRFAVDLTINEGKFDDFQGCMHTMISATRKEAGALGYDSYLSSDRRRCRILETYADANAVLAHLTGPVVQQWVPKLLEASSLSRFEVYGDPGPEASRMLASFGAEIFALWQGLGN
ncbi:MAG: antibiotic biosynthesis monooxygenase [Terriglobales bacterium]|jgi:quinol monooxygenase YgiN